MPETTSAGIAKSIEGLKSRLDGLARLIPQVGGDSSEDAGTLRAMLERIQTDYARVLNDLGALPAQLDDQQSQSQRAVDALRSRAGTIRATTAARIGAVPPPPAVPKSPAAAVPDLRLAPKVARDLLERIGQPVERSETTPAAGRSFSSWAFSNSGPVDESATGGAARDSLIVGVDDAGERFSISTSGPSNLDESGSPTAPHLTGSSRESAWLVSAAGDSLTGGASAAEPPPHAPGWGTWLAHSRASESGQSAVDPQKPKPNIRSLQDEFDAWSKQVLEDEESPPD